MITTLEPSWREWIVTNLGRNCSQESIAGAMIEKGFDPQFARAVVSEMAAQAPGGLPGTPATGLAATALPAAPRHGETVGAAAGRLAPGNTIALTDHEVAVLARLVKPDLAVLANVLSHAECDELVRRSQEKLARSTAIDPTTGKPKVIEHRSSYGTYFHIAENEFIASIDRRLSELLRWPIERAEGIQILRYEVGGEYRPHFDYFPPEQQGSATHTANGGQRVATLIMYLNDVEAGGETIFPEIGLRVTPRRGHAVYFGYCDSRGRVDPLTLHGGAPVAAGEKWIATKWLRQDRRV
jgi:prolyl 4-hydroxylase